MNEFEAKEKGRFKAICLKTYVDEDDMESFCCGDISKPCEVRVYLKDSFDYVTKLADPEYWKIIE